MWQVGCPAPSETQAESVAPWSHLLNLVWDPPNYVEEWREAFEKTPTGHEFYDQENLLPGMENKTLRLQAPGNEDSGVLSIGTFHSGCGQVLHV